MEMMNRRGRMGAEIWFARHIYTGDPSIGLGQISLSTAAMLEGDIPWRESRSGSAADREAVREAVSEAYSGVGSRRREAILEQLAAASSNINTAARLLARLKNRPHRFPRITVSQLLNNRDALAILGTEYHLGPTQTPLSNARPEDYGRSVAMLAASSAMGEVLNA
jgi:hypothetical protein